MILILVPLPPREKRKNLIIQNLDLHELAAWPLAIGTVYILKDSIRNTTAVCNPRQIQSETNSVQDKIESEKKIFLTIGKKNSQTEFCIGLHFVSD